MRLGALGARACAIVSALGLVTGMIALFAGPAAAAVTCPTVDATGTVSSLPYQGIDWSGCDLSGADLTGLTFSNANLIGANLSGAALDQAALDTANLTNANLSNATLTSADLDWANLTGANLTGASLHGAYLLWAFLTNSVLDQADLSGTNLTGLTSGGITGSPALLPTGFSLADGYLIGPNVNMADANLSGISLPGSDLSGASLKNADLSGADLIGDNFTNTDLTSADFTSADLTGANLSGTTLTDTDLTTATLDGASSGGITGTPLSLPANWQLVGNGYLAGPQANLANANLSYQTTYNADLAGANLTGATLIGASFRYANFGGANMSNALLTSADFNNTDLTSADLTGADLTGADLSSTNLAGTILTSATLAEVGSGGITGTPQALPVNWSLAAGYLIGPYAFLDSANLAHADLSGLDFYHAFLAYADLSYASLAGANMTGVQIGGNIWLDTICPDGTNSNQYLDGCFSTLDTTAPTATPAVTSGTVGTNGWYTSPVTVTWHWSDNGTLDTTNCATSSTTSDQGNPVTLDATCLDLAGNQGNASYSVKVDTAPPTVSVTGVTAGKNYIYGKVPAAACHTADDLSGVAAAATVTVTTTGTHGAGSFTATCAGAADVAGNPQAAPVSVSYTVGYGFGGFTSPKPGSAIAKSAGVIPVGFQFANAAGTPIQASWASALAAAGDVRVTLTGPGISPTSALCSWNGTTRLFGCTIKIPAGVKTGSGTSYSITAAENVGTGFGTAPAVLKAVNPEEIHFK